MSRVHVTWQKSPKSFKLSATKADLATTNATDFLRLGPYGSILDSTIYSLHFSASPSELILLSFCASVSASICEQLDEHETQVKLETLQSFFIHVCN